MAKQEAEWAGVGRDWHALHQARTAVQRDRARSTLLTRYGGLVHATISRLHVYAPGYMDACDVQAAGMGGLVQAIDTYDAARGVRFETYAIGRIRAALYGWVRSCGRPTPADGDVVTTWSEPADTPDVQVEAAERSAAVAAAVSALPERVARLLRWRYEQQRTLASGARELGISATRAHQLVQQGLVTLRRNLDTAGWIGNE